MDPTGNENLEMLLELAKTYDRKYRQLTGIGSRTPLQELLPGLIQRAELTTDRARAAQQYLAQVMTEAGSGDPDLSKAAVSLCECFDEVLILFQVLAEKASREPTAV